MSERHATCPPVPPHRKAFGTAVNVDGDVLLYTEAEMEAHGLRCFRAGQQLSGMAGAIQAEEDAWAAYRSGRGPRPRGAA
jgi:hypothetical protein